MTGMNTNPNHRTEDSDMDGNDAGAQEVGLDAISRKPVDRGVSSIMDAIMADLAQLAEDPQRDDWSFIFKAAMSEPSGKAFMVDPRDPSSITVDLGYMPSWMTFNIMTSVEDQPIILSLTAPEMQVVSIAQINEWTRSVDCSYWVSTADGEEGFDLVGALNDWAALGMLRFTRSSRIDPSWSIHLRFED